MTRDNRAPWFASFVQKSNLYDQIQSKRPDYALALKCLENHIARILTERDSIDACLDVGCGSGAAISLLNGKENVNTRVGLDTDPALLEIAKRKCPGLECVVGDAADGPIFGEFDLLLASFIYHHIEDSRKSEFCHYLRRLARKDADLLVLEICLANEEEVQTYYSRLAELVHGGNNGELTKTFLDWTSNEKREVSGEWKVSEDRLVADLTDAGWQIQTKESIWPATATPVPGGCLLMHCKAK